MLDVDHFYSVAGVQNRMCIHPEFLHSNATSHKWPFGGKAFVWFQTTIFLLYCVVSYFLCLVTAVAELLDNAVDEVIEQIHYFFYS